MNPNYYYLGVFVAIISLTFLVGYLVNRVLSRVLKKAIEIMSIDPTNYRFLKHVVLGGIYLIGFSIAIYVVPNLRALAGTMLAGAGILAVAVGFASQHALSNVVSGVFIVIFKPFRINDRLSLQTHQGIVEDITLRHTVIRNFENRRIVIPNSIISNEIIVNADFAEEKICKWIDIGISYSSSIDLAKSIMEDEVLKHPLHVDPRSPEDLELGLPEVPVRVLSLGDSSVNLRAWVWTVDAADAFIIGCDLYESIKKRFDREGVEIPFPHRTVYVKMEPKAEVAMTQGKE
jgi:small-conductance mechanosensitive channel